MPELTISPVNDGVYRVLDARRGHVGNLKRIGGQWKFKAIGYGPNGQLIPGGGPLTEQHNTSFAAPDAEIVSATLMQSRPATPATFRP